MTTQEQPELPDLRSARLHYARAIAATDAARAVAEQPALYALWLERRMAYHQCRIDEHEAGRAYMALLAEMTPTEGTCSACGASMELAGEDLADPASALCADCG